MFNYLKLEIDIFIIIQTNLVSIFNILKLKCYGRYLRIFKNLAI